MQFERIFPPRFGASADFRKRPILLKEMKRPEPPIFIFCERLDETFPITIDFNLCTHARIMAPRGDGRRRDDAYLTNCRLAKG